MCYDRLMKNEFASGYVEPVTGLFPGIKDRIKDLAGLTRGGTDLLPSTLRRLKKDETGGALVGFIGSCLVIGGAGLEGLSLALATNPRTAEAAIFSIYGIPGGLLVILGGGLLAARGFSAPK